MLSKKSVKKAIKQVLSNNSEYQDAVARYIELTGNITWARAQVTGVQRCRRTEQVCTNFFNANPGLDFKEESTIISYCPNFSEDVPCTNKNCTYYENNHFYLGLQKRADQIKNELNFTRRVIEHKILGSRGSK